MANGKVLLLETQSNSRNQRKGPVGGNKPAPKGTTALSESGGRLSDAVFDKAPVGLVVTDMDGSILKMNPVLRELTGHHNGTLARLNASDLYTDPFDRRRFLAALRTHGYARNIELRVKRKDGSSWHVLIDSNLIPLDDRDLIVSSLKDATDSARIKEALQISEDKFAKLFNVCPIAISLVCLEDGRHLQVNDSFVNATGWSRDELIGRTDIDLSLWADLQSRERYIRELYENGHVKEYELHWRNRGGEIRVALSSAEMIVIETRSCAIVTCVDITERKRTDEALRESRHFLESIINTIPVRVFWKDRDLRYLGCNALFARDAGFESSEDIVGLDDNQMAWKEQAESYRRDDRAVIDSGLPRFLYEEQQTTPAGETIHLLTSKIPLRNAEQQVIGILGIYLDVTKEKNLQARLQMSQKMEAIGQLAGGVAHDFNNLLQVIGGHTTLSILELPSNSPAIDNLRTVSDAVERAADLIKQLLTFGRRQVLKMESLDLNCLIRNFLKMIARIIGEHIRIEFVEGGSIGNIKADKGMVEQVLMNLCMNARDAMPDGGKLFIGTETITLDGAYCEAHPWAKAGRYVSMKVTDTGCGMDAKTMSRIYEPFFTTKEFGHGTGLGLATVYGIVKQHGGSISVCSELGHGSTFVIYLPITEEKEQSKAAPEMPPPDYHGHETILLTDDDDLVREVGVEILKQAGYAVLAAANGREAVNLFNENGARIQLFVTDVMMPDMTGPEAYSTIHQMHPDVPVIFCSGYSDSAICERFDLKPDTMIVPKPYRVDELLKLVRQTLDSR